MAFVKLKYGKSELVFQYDATRFDVLGEERNFLPLSDVQINQHFDNPFFSSPIEDLIRSDESVLIVVPDATRKAACGQVLNLLIRRLIVSGVKPHKVGIIFATGIHRPVTEDEKKRILTPFIYQRIKHFDHSAKDFLKLAGIGSSFAHYGYTSNGIRIELNKLLLEYDHIVLIGGVTFHYFAGFTGGRKLVCPGLASEHTISETHKLAFDFEKKTRRQGVGIGLLKGNLVHETFVEIAGKVKPTFSVNTIANERDEAVSVFCGDWKLAHEKACSFYLENHSLKISEKRDCVVVSCGGFPFDLNLIQAHKALESASYACKEGGMIIFIAECADGLGREDFLKWFEVKDSEELAERLCQNYEVNGQTAWSLLKKAENFNIKILTNLNEEACLKMRMEKIDDLNRFLPNGTHGYILPYGAKFLTFMT